MSSEFSGLKFGCVIFDDPVRREQGWKAIGEGESSRVNMEGTSALSSDTVWLTNMNYQIGAESGLRDNYRFLVSDYLREDIMAIAARYNITDSRRIAELGAKLLNRTMLLSAKLLEAEEDFPLRGNLRRGFREIVGIGKNPLVTTDMANRINEATTNNTNCEREAGGRHENDVVGIYRIPPREHCLRILDTMLPFGDFVEVPKNELPDQKADQSVVQEFLKEHGGTPGIYKITCRSFNPNFNNLINYGDSAGGSGGPYRRQWVSSPEVLMLSSLADITIHQAFVTPSTFRLRDPMKIADKLPWQADLSMTVGIFFENLWTGISIRGCRKSPNSPEKVYINTFTPFLRAMDRMLLFDRAVKFQAAGFEVLGYSTGRLRINLVGKSALDAYKIALETGTIPPFLGLKSSELPALSEKESRNPLCHQQIWHATNNLTQMLEWDFKVVRHLLNK